MKYLITAIMLLLSFTSNSQVGVGTITPEITSMLEAKSTSKGFLPPRMTLAQFKLINVTASSKGLIVYCTDFRGNGGEWLVYNGNEWTNFIGTPMVVVGQSYQGGKVAYILQSGDPGYDPSVQHGLIAATSNLNDARWYNGVNTTTNATETSIGTGFLNTNTIITSQGNTGSYAAKLCRDYTGGGYTDWYLPSKDELNKLYINRAAIGGFANTNNIYWSSTEFNSSVAHAQEFDPNGTQIIQYKAISYSVRAIRAF